MAAVEKSTVVAVGNSCRETSVEGLLSQKHSRETASVVGEV
jgi:hypothetical protein